MNILFRVDASIQLGSGHVMRCLALAERLRDQYANVKFISRLNKGNLNNFIMERGFDLIKLEKPSNKIDIEELMKPDIQQYNKWLGVSEKQDAQDTINCIIDKKINWLIVDHYALGEKWGMQLRPFVKNIMVIDDLANRKYECDLLLDQNYDENLKTRYNKLVPRKCIKLLGPKYALLRNEFSVLRKIIKPRKNFKKILISFGGSDPTNETEKVLSAIKILKTKKQFRKEVDVTISNSNKNKYKIKQLCNSIPNAKFYQNVYKIGKLMYKADLAVGAGGSSTWERFCLGLPAIVSIVADHQQETTEALAKKECLINVGLAKNLSVKKYVEIFENLDIKKLQNISKNSLKVVDGKGSVRVAKKIRLLQST